MLLRRIRVPFILQHFQPIYQLHPRMARLNHLIDIAATACDVGIAELLRVFCDQFLAALILFNFGEGPVKGFAWTLSIGCITSVITATFVTQTLVAIWFRITRPKQLPI